MYCVGEVSLDNKVRCGRGGTLLGGESGKALQCMSVRTGEPCF